MKRVSCVVALVFGLGLAASVFAGEAGGEAKPKPPEAGNRQAGTPNVGATQKTTGTNDANVNGKVNPGEGVRTNTKVENAGTGKANNVKVKIPLDANTKLVAGSLKSTPVGADDNLTAYQDTLLVLPAPGVLGNDFERDWDGLLNVDDGCQAALKGDAKKNLKYTLNFSLILPMKPRRRVGLQRGLIKGVSAVDGEKKCA